MSKIREYPNDDNLNNQHGITLKVQKKLSVSKKKGISPPPSPVDFFFNPN
jgi:hypothetical protein